MNKYILSFLIASLAITNAFGQNKQSAVHPGGANPPNFTSFPVQEVVPADIAAKVNPGKTTTSSLTYTTLNEGGTRYIEVISKRKANESYYVDPEHPEHFCLTKGINALNYQKDGQWFPVDVKLKPMGDKVYEAPGQWDPVGIDVKGQSTYIRTVKGNVQFNNWSLYGSSGANETLLAKADWSNYTVGADGIRVKDIFPGIDAEMRVSRGSVKTNFIVHQLRFPQYSELYFQDQFKGLSANGLHFADKGNDDGKTSVSATVNGTPDVLKILPALVYEQGNAASATVMPYRIVSNDLRVIVTTAYIRQHLLNGAAVVIDPQVTSTNTIAQSLVGTPYNASCTWTTSCDYTINVVPPAGATITDVQDQVEVIATAPCGLENFGYQITSGTCISPNPGVVWIANGPTGPGTMWAGFYSEPNLVACMPAPSCTPTGVNVTFRLFRTCVGPTTPACDNTCLGLNNPLSVRIVGYTAQYASIAAYPADTTCYGNTLGIKAVPQYGKPPYTVTNWSFSSTGTPSIGSGDSISLGVLAPGTYTVYANATDACGTVLQTSKVVKVYPIPAVSTVTKTNPTTCSGSDGSVTLYGLAASTVFTVNYNKNGAPAGPVTLTSDAAGALSIYGLTAGTYTSFQLTAHGCTSGVSALSTTLTNPLPSAVSVTGNPCISNVITMTANPSWAINAWQFNGSPVITDTIRTWNATGTIVAGGNGTGTALNQFATGPLGVSVDVTGNVYVADNNNHRVVKWQPGATTGIVVAGGNGAGSGLNQFNAPYGVYADADSNVYVVDRNNHRIIKWAPGAAAGVVVAGGNGAGSGANQINNPRGVFVDEANNVYITDFNNNRIQKWAPGATAGTTVAGGNGAGSAANQLNQPVNIYVDASGNIYISDFANNRIQKWAPGATAGTTVAGGNGAGSAANQLNGPRGIELDPIGNIYIADQNNNRVQRWVPGAANGITVAGGNGAGAALNQLNAPVDMAVSADGALYVLEQNNLRVNKFTPKATDTLVAGASGTYTANITSFNGCTNTASISWVQKPVISVTANPGSIVCAGASVTFTATVVNGGTSPVYTWKRNGTTVGSNSATFTTSALTDKDVISCTFSSSNPCTVTDSMLMTVNPLPVVTLTGNPCTANMIVMNSNPTWSVSAWQNNGTPIVTDTNKWNSFGVIAAGGNGAGSGLNQVNFPLGVFADAAGNTYVADPNNHRIVKWAPGATSGTIVAGGNGAGSAANQLSYPFAVAVDADTNVYVMEWGNARVSKWAYGATTGTVVAGGNGNGSGLNQLNAAQGLFVDASKNVYVADNSNQRIVKWAPGATAGVIVAGGNGAGSGLNQFNGTVSVYVDGANNVYVSDYSNHRIMKWAPGATSGTVAAGGNGAGSAANQLNGPRVSWLDGSGNIYVCDQNNNRIQRWRPGATSGTTVAGGNGAGTGLNQFNSPTSIYVSNKGEIYTVEQNNNRALRFSPQQTDTLIPTNSATYTATVTAFNGCTNTGTINWIQGDTIKINASPGYQVCDGTPVTFTATVVNGGTSPVYVWKKNGTPVGANSATYTATGLSNNDRISCTFSSSNPCTVTDSVVMTVNPKPVATISGLPCTGKTLTINPGVTALQTQWMYNGNPIQTYNAAWQQNGTVVAGGNGAGSALNQLNNPCTAFVDAAGNILIADNNNQRIVKWAPAATAGTVVAGGNGSGAALNQFVWGNSVIPGYNSMDIFVSDANNNRVTKWIQGGAAGVIVAGGNGSGTAANQVRPFNAALDGYGNLFLPDVNGSSPRVQKWKMGYGYGTTVAGGNGLGGAANQFNQPYAIAIANNATDIYVTDPYNFRVQKWTSGGTTGTTVAGGNGSGAAANQLNYPLGLELDGLNNMYIADAGNNRIQRWLPGATSGTTIIGGNGAGAALNQLNSPDGIFMDGNGNIYVPENSNHRVTRFQAYNTDSLVTSNAGIYKVIITSFEGCSDSATYTVNPTPAIAGKTSVNPTTCAGTNGSITLNGLTANTSFSVSYNKNGSAAGPVTITSNGSGGIVITGLSAGTYNSFSVTATATSCVSATDTATITLTDPSLPAAPVLSSNSPVCSGGSLTVTAANVTGGTFAWTGPNLFTSNAQSNTINNVTTAANGNYSATVTVNGCISPAATITVTVNLTPAITTTPSASPTTCGGSDGTLTLNGLTAGATYTVNYTYNSTAQAPQTLTANGSGAVVITGLSSGSYTSISVSRNGCTSNVIAGPIAINPPAAPVIGTTASASPTTCGGTNGTITLNGLTASTSYTVTYLKNGTPQTGTYTTNASGTLVITGLTQGTYTTIGVTLNNCNSGTVGPFTLSDPAIPAAPTAGSNTPVCQGTNLNLTATGVTGATFTWSGPSFSSTSQNPVIPNMQSANIGTYSVTQTVAGCVSAAGTTTVAMNTIPAQPGTITGNTRICAGSAQAYSIASVSGATSYTWTLPSGWTGTSTTNTINATVGTTSGAGVISITANNVCGSSTARTLADTVLNIPAQPGVISGNASVCSGSAQSYNIAAVPEAVTYTWTVPTGWAATSSNTTSMNTTAATATGTGNITVTATNQCGTSTPRNLAVSVSNIPATPGTISGSVNICAGSAQVYGVAPVAEATSYTWTLPSTAGWAGTSSTNTINTTVGTVSGAGSIIVRAANFCGTSGTQSLTVNVTNIPAAPGAITGNTNVCAGTAQPYSIATVPEATSYTWTIPGAGSGWTTTGPLTSNTLSTTAGTQSGTITVAAVNFCGTSAVRSLAVTATSIPVQPGTISGNTNVCGGSLQPYSVAAVAQATSYTWTIPQNGWTATGASGTTVLSTTPNLASTAGTAGGTISVVASNQCGVSPSRSLNVTVTNIPGTAGTVSGPDSLCAGAGGIWSIGYVNEATSYVWTVPSSGGWTGSSTGLSISASSGTATPGGPAVITVAGTNFCGTGVAATKNVWITRPVAPTLNLVSTTPAVCSGMPVTFTATSTDGGNAPLYQWRINGLNTGTASGSPIFTSNSLNNGDVVSVVLNSSATCAIPRYVTSNAIAVQVTPTVIPGVNINASQPAPVLCTGMPVTFTATPLTGAGSSPSYQWLKNGVSVGNNSVNYIDATLSTSDSVWVIMTSSALCVTTPTATSNKIGVHVWPIVTPSVTVTASPGTAVAMGTPVTFTATAVNGGTNPSWQWMKNGLGITGATGSTYTTNSLRNGDVISVQLQADQVCLASGSAVVSNSLSMLISTDAGSVSASLAGEVRLYPSPNGGRFTVEVKGGHAGRQVKLEVLSVLGQLVGATAVTPDKGDWSVDMNLNDAAAGMYMLRLVDAENGKLMTIRKFEVIK